MDRLLARLERRLGRHAVPNLTFIVAAGMALTFVVSYTRPEFEDLLVLDTASVLRGQVWRLVTWLFLPPPAGSFFMPRPIAMLFAIYFVWLIGSNLEQAWGTFKLNAFYVVGMLGTTIAAALLGGATNHFLNLSLFLAFATVFPDYRLLIFYVIPVRVKWLGLLSAAWMAWTFAGSGWETRAAIGAALANYALFFVSHWATWWRGRNLRVRQAARRAGSVEARPTLGARVCALCGAREDEGADIRVCSCEACGGKPRTLCLPHARSH